MFLLQIILGDAFTNAGIKSDVLIRQGQLWRLITPIFLHSPTDLLHIVFNMYALYAIGPEVERTLGYGQFLIVYFAAGYCGFLASFVLSSADSLGASGAIFGLLGAFAVFLYQNHKTIGPMGRNMLTNVLLVIGLNIVISLTVPGIDLWGHFGGLLSGAALAWFIGPRWAVEIEMITGYPRLVDRNPPAAQGLKLAIAAVVLGAITIAAFVL